MDIKELVKTQREFYQTQYTKDINHRIQTLKALRTWILEHQNRIIEALKKDLNKDAVESYMCEIGLVLSELNYQLKHIKKWSRNKYVWTPISQFYGTSFESYEPYGVTLIMSSLELSFHVIN